MSHRKRAHRKKTGSGIRRLVAGLLTASVVLVLLPESWTTGLMSLVQVLVPFQDGASETIAPITRAVRLDDATYRTEDFQKIADRNAALVHTVSALSLRVQELEAENDLLSATRLWNPDGHRFGSSGRLIPGRMIVSDMLAWRSSRLLNAGTLQGVRQGQGVVSRYFSLDRGEADGVADGMAILLKESLIGFVEDVGTHTARVRLLGDVSTEMKVRIGRILPDGPPETLDRYYWLTGTTKGLMEIRDVEGKDVDAGLIAIGDIVLAPAVAGRLPTAMCIGEIQSIRVDRDNPLLSILSIASRVDYDSLSRVYVFEPDPGES